ncbi:uncharacterized protein HGUI_02099 [Hanseniaspora guilliermondii]|uniref:Uncharacterized protein n=1 Tax=Hanseniaspora guilliermondii TaxID=56406 RepID=A0A1L0B4D8_9ASCO|nr:uncharacterized protein HGUI_02099 [Hanseniaspora guilliermondii]
MDDINSQIYEKKIVKSGSMNNYCLVCMEATKICLYKKIFYHCDFNNKTYSDWFYVCESHLKSADFLESCQSQEILDLKKELKSLQENIKDIRKKIDNEKELNKGPVWLNKALSSTGSYISNKLPFSGSSEMNEDEKADKDLILEKKTDKQEIEDLLDNITGREQQIKKLEGSIKFYKLSEFTYMNRKDTLATSLKQKFIKKPEIPSKQSTVTALKFPTVPNHEI